MKIEPTILKSKAVEIIAMRITTGDDLRTKKNKINGLINTRINRGQITFADSRKTLLNSSSVALSLKDKFPEVFHDWNLPVVLTGSNCSQVNKSSTGILTHNNLDTIHGCLDEIDRLKKIISEMSDEIKTLKPLADRYSEICVINSKNGRKRPDR